MIFSLHKDFIIAVYLFEPDPELHSGTERSSFSDKFRRPGPEPSVLSVNLAGSGPVMIFIDSPCGAVYSIVVYIYFFSFNSLSEIIFN